MNLSENKELFQVRGYRLVKRSLQRCLVDIENDRKAAHVDEPYMDK